MNIWGLLLRVCGWKVDITVPYRGKCVICVAPHTSNWDFPLGFAAWRSVGRKASFLMKEDWFFFPLGYLFRAMGGIPVPRERGSDLSGTIVRRFASSRRLNLAVTPEGTRSARSEWRKGFLRIARDAGVPVQLGVIDYASRTVSVCGEFTPVPDIEADLRRVKDFYASMGAAARYPHKFLT